MNCNDLIEKICHWIKWKARRLEEDECFRQQLDVYFNLLRNVLRNFKLNAISRALILEVIELRAANWTNVEDIDRYYRNKLSQLKANDTSCAGNDLSRSKSLQSFGLNDGSKASPKSPKVMGKTSLRHEVVIRNGDSGKVPPGAKERVVQIMGPTEENIERAKHLIEETIIRNTSPVPFETYNKPAVDLDVNHNQKSEVIEKETIDTTVRPEALYEDKPAFTFTVNVGNDVIQLSTNNYSIGIKAKEVLQNEFCNKSDPKADTYCGDDLKEQQMENMRTNDKLEEQVIPADESEYLETDPKLDTIQRQQSYEGKLPIGRTSLRFMCDVKPKLDVNEKIAYEREFLMNCAESPLSQVMDEKEIFKIQTKTPDILRKNATSDDLEVW